MVALLLLALPLAAAGPAESATGPVLVIVAHPDDEALGMAGIIASSRAAGRLVYVAVVTNGDAHAGSSTSGYCGAASGSPAAYARTGLIRVKETVAAMALLNVPWTAVLPASNVFFLGYPDAALTTVASSSSPWMGDRTGLHRTYAEDGDGLNATCNGDFRFLLSGQHSQLSAGALAADIDAVLTSVRPSDLYTHAGIDSHSDHAEVYRQVLSSLQRTNVAATLHTTLIHPEDRSDCLSEWPNPSLASVGGSIQGRFTPTSDFTAPPRPSCVGSTTLSWGSWGPPNEWVEVPASMQATTEASNLKWQVLSKYGSQVAWCPGACDYFRAFVKRREFFWTSSTGGGSTTCASGQYTAEYFNNKTLTGTAILSRCEAAIAYNWGSGGPGGGVANDNFSTRWTGSFSFPGGSTTFRARADDGVRVWVDGALVIDAWKDQAATDYSATRTLTAGSHSVKVEYYEAGGAAVAQVSWSTGTTSPPPPSPPPPSPPPPSPPPTPTTCSLGQYAAQYFNNKTLTGTAILSRCEAAIAYNWGFGGPGGGVGNDNFSARWTGSFSFPAGSTTFRARADDGVRLWVDGALLIDAWKDQAATDYSATRSLTAGTHSVKVEYYEAGSAAVAQVSWAPATAPPPPTACSAGQYAAEYFNNKTLTGTAILSRCEAAISYNWGSGGPGGGVANDNFSARWTGSFSFPGGSTTFRARADDGVRVWVDGVLVISAWKDQPATDYSGTRTLTAGSHTVKVEYYEAGGAAVAQVSWTSP